MPLIALEIQNVRIYEHAKISPDPCLNLIVGSNASGKTTLLEAIHLLSVGRSFRTSQIEQIQNRAGSGLSVQGKVTGPGTESSTHIGLVHTEQGRRATVNGLVQTQMSALAQHLPLQVISPDTHYEFRNSARHRRGALDWGLFHVEPDFLGLWNRYQRIVQQRNAALKGPAQAKARHVWDEDLAITGEALHLQRKGLVTHLKAYYQLCCQELLGAGYEADLIFESGWEDGKSLAECLRRDQTRDCARGFTHSGPHRADLKIELHTHSAQVDASHGQYKLLVVALRLAQIRNFLEKTPPMFVPAGTASRPALPPSMAVVGPGWRHCCLLIDDLSAELDSEHRARLARLLSRLPVQLFVTATEAALIERRYWPSHKAFHVEQGTIEECA